MTEMIEAATDMTIKTVTASELHVSDVQLDGHAGHLVTSVRLLALTV